jgi:hypothetical protein
VGLTAKYTVAAGRLPDLFAKIRDGQAPQQFTQQILKDWGLTSSHDREMIPLLKDLGFLSPDGRPTSRYHDYRDHSRSKAIMAEALHEAYADIFLIKEHPTDADREAISGKFKSFHNVSDNVAGWLTKTFFTLLSLSDLKARKQKEKEAPSSIDRKTTVNMEQTGPIGEIPESRRIQSSSLHYNIQIHLPATKDIEVYNAIFKSLRQHLFES